APPTAPAGPERRGCARRAARVVGYRLPAPPAAARVDRAQASIRHGRRRPVPVPGEATTSEVETVRVVDANGTALRRAYRKIRQGIPMKQKACRRLPRLRISQRERT